MTDDPLAPFGRDAPRAGVFLDFDGVLADIAATPDAATIRPGSAALIEQLRPLLGRLAIVSGRPVSYVAEMVPAEVEIVGLYGLEWRLDGRRHTLPEAESWRATISDLTTAAVAEFGEEVVEPKGLSLTIHYRGDRRLRQAMDVWTTEQAARSGIEARQAKRSFEVHPPIRRDKGTVVEELAQGLDPVAYVGDDVGDLPAFDGLDRLAERGVSTLRVAVTSEEAPPILLRRADHVVAGPAGAEALLRRLLELID